MHCRNSSASTYASRVQQHFIATIIINVGTLGMLYIVLSILWVVWCTEKNVVNREHYLLSGYKKFVMLLLLDLSNWHNKYFEIAYVWVIVSRLE